MWTLPNILSLTRVPLALIFLVENPALRTVAILLALATDGLDGYLARKYRQTSQLGAAIDPLTDKFFVLVILSIFIREGRLLPWQAAALLSRDCAVFIFGFYLLCSGRLKDYRIEAIISGKITTVLQSLFFLLLIFNMPPSLIFFLFFFLGITSLLELFSSRRSLKQ